ncbi:MAG: hypothetical protein HYW48_03745 [Deltaproteobacteria bacterium]|nr:hypothetical protein [Deltaproteobacteria bacterium]
MKPSWLLVLFLAISCKEKTEEDKPYFYTTEEQKLLKTRKEKCEADPKMHFSDSSETCVDILEREKKQCESQKTTKWDEEKRECVSDPVAVDVLRERECIRKGKTYSDGFCQ